MDRRPRRLGLLQQRRVSRLVKRSRRLFVVSRQEEEKTFSTPRSSESYLTFFLLLRSSGPDLLSFRQMWVSWFASLASLAFGYCRLQTLESALLLVRLLPSRRRRALWFIRRRRDAEEDPALRASASRITAGRCICRSSRSRDEATREGEEKLLRCGRQTSVCIRYRLVCSFCMWNGYHDGCTLQRVYTEIYVGEEDP